MCCLGLGLAIEGDQKLHSSRPKGAEICVLHEGQHCSPVMDSSSVQVLSGEDRPPPALWEEGAVAAWCETARVLETFDDC